MTGWTSRLKLLLLLLLLLILKLLLVLGWWLLLLLKLHLLRWTHHITTEWTRLGRWLSLTWRSLSWWSTLLSRAWWPHHWRLPIRTRRSIRVAHWRHSTLLVLLLKHWVTSGWTRWTTLLLLTTRRTWLERRLHTCALLWWTRRNSILLLVVL